MGVSSVPQLVEKDALVLKMASGMGGHNALVALRGAEDKSTQSSQLQR